MFNGTYSLIDTDPAERWALQLNIILSRLDAALASSRSPAAPASIEDIEILDCFRDLVSSRVLDRLQSEAQLGSEVAYQSLRRISLRTNALLASHPNDITSLATGFALALQIAEQNGWESEEGVLRYGETWLTAGLTYLSTASGRAPPSSSSRVGLEFQHNAMVLRPLLSLLSNHILSPATTARPEYHRSVVASALPKFAASIVGLVESILKRHDVNVGPIPPAQESSLSALFVTLASEINSHSSIYRPFSQRLHDAGSPLLLSEHSSIGLVYNWVEVLARLPLTGAASSTSNRSRVLVGGALHGKATQGELWAATIKMLLASARDAVSVCTSTFDDPITTTFPAAKLRDNASPTDSVKANALATQRLDRLLGSPSSSTIGVLPHLLNVSTSKAMPLPIASLVSTAVAIISISPTPPSKRGSDASLHALQITKLPDLHRRALLLLAACMPLISHAGIAARARFWPLIVQNIARLLLEKGIAIPVKVAALATLTIGGDAGSLLVDPSSPILLRAAQACLDEISKLLVPSSAIPKGKSNAPATSSRQSKRRKLYESDATFSTPAVAILGLKSVEEQKLSVSAMRAFAVFFPLLLTSATEVHYDLAHRGVTLIAGVAELCIRQPAPVRGGSRGDVDLLAVGSLTALTSLAEQADGSFLALIAPKMSEVSSLALSCGLSHTSLAVAAAARRSLLILRTVCLPRLPPVLAAQIENGAAERSLNRDWPSDPNTGVQAKSRSAFPPMASVDVSGSQMKEAIKDNTGVDVDAEVLPQAEEAVSDTASPHMTPSPTPAVESSPNGMASHTIEPVKPLSRPEVPKIGSPKSRQSSLGSKALVEAQGSPEAKEVFGHPTSPRKVQTELLPSPAAGFAQDKRMSLEIEVDSDDEEIPQIVLGRDTDEED